MQSTLGYFLLELILIIIFCQGAKATSPPPPPNDVRIESTGREFLVQWTPPTDVYGGIVEYLVKYNVLPSLEVFTNIVAGNDTFSLVPHGDNIGQLFKITLQASNDYGLGKETVPRYMRATCGDQLFIVPGEEQTILSPLYPENFHQGVLCVWNLLTNKTHRFNIQISEMEMGANDENCKTNYLHIDVANSGTKVCSKSSDILIESSETTILFKSGRGEMGKGFKTIIQAVVKTPSPPSDITLSRLKRAILVTWSPPEDIHQRVSSYKVCHQILPMTSKICVIVLANPNNRFIISTRGHQGQVYAVSLTTRIEGVESKFSTNKILRASCSKTIIIKMGKTLQTITSPGYPDPYPPGVICDWSVRTEDNSPLTIHRKWIDIQNSTACSDDYLKFVSTKVERICGTSKESSTMIFPKGSVQLTFVSDEKVQQHGFILEAFGSMLPEKSASITTEGFYSHSSQTTNVPTTEMIPSVHSTSIPSITRTEESVQPQTTSVNSNEGPTEEEHVFESTVTDPITTLAYSTLLGHSLTTSVLLPITSAIPVSSSYSKQHKGRPTTSSPNEQTTIHTSLTYTGQIVTETGKVGSMATTEIWHSGTESSISTNSSKMFGDRNLSHAIFIMIMFHFNASRGEEYNMSALIPDLENELIPYFKACAAFSTLKIIKWRLLHELIPVELSVNYGVPQLLYAFKENSSYRLIQCIQETAIHELLARNQRWPGGLTLNKPALQKLQRSSMFLKQEIKDPCSLLSDICLTCQLDKTLSYGVRCDMSSTSAYLLTTSSYKLVHNVDNHTLIIIGTVTGSALLAIIVVGIIMYLRKCSKRQIVFEDINNVAVHDFVKSKGSANVNITRFSPYKADKKIKRRGWSLPCRIMLKKQKEDREINEVVQKLGKFIDDTNTLAKRLNIKRRLRRGDSV